MIGIDLDGTIEDSRRDMASSVGRIRAQLGLPARPPEAIYRWMNRGMDLLYRSCFDDYVQGSEVRLAEIRRRYERDYLENVAHETKPYPGIPEALRLLAEMRPLVVVTNKPERISRRLLEALKIDKFFAAIVGGDTCAASKPDPMILAEAVRRCGSDPGNGRCVMVGDSSADIKMGRAYGALTVWCEWGYARNPEETPDLIAKHPRELPNLVRVAIENKR